MAKGEVANHLQEQAQGHRGYTESVITDRAHGYQPGDDDGNSSEPGEVGVDPLHGAKPEETNKEERYTADNPEE